MYEVVLPVAEQLVARHTIDPQAAEPRGDLASFLEQPFAVAPRGGGRIVACAPQVFGRELAERRHLFVEHRQGSELLFGPRSDLRRDVPVDGLGAATDALVRDDLLEIDRLALGVQINDATYEAYAGSLPGGADRPP